MAEPAVIDLALYRDRRAVLLCAPAGFGKTRAMRSLADRLAGGGATVRWIDAADPAIRGMRPTDLLARIGEGAAADTLFIDEADRLPAPVRGELRAAFETGGPGGRLVLAARSPEGLHFGRWQADGDALLIDGRLLRLSRAQLARRWSGRLTAEQIRQVDLLAEGWAAPAQLLAAWLAAEGRFDPEGLFLRRSLAAGFVEEELLAVLPPQWLAPLAAAALPDAFDAPLLDRLAGASAHLTLRRIETRLGPLLVETGGKGEWRFNALLKRVLAERLDSLDPDRVAALRDTVAEWAMDHGDIVTAARLGADHLTAAQLGAYIERVGGLKLWLTRGYDALRALMEIAGPLADSEPRLKLLRCAVLLKDGRAGDADRLYEEAVAELPDDPGAARDAALVHATLLIYGCRATSPEDEAVFRHMRDFESDPAFTTMLPTLLAIRHAQQGELDQATADIAEARAYAQATGVHYNLMFLDLHAAVVAQAKGNLAEARRLIASARRRWRGGYRDDRGAETVIEALAAQVAFEQGRFAEAERHVQRSGRRLPGSEAWFDIYLAAFEPMVRLQAMEHGLGAALATLERVRRQLVAHKLDRVAAVLASLGLCLSGEAGLRSEGGAAAQALAAAATPVLDDAATWQEREIGLLAAAHVALARGDPAGADAILARLIADARARGLRRVELRAWLLRGAAADRAGDAARADEAVLAAVRIGAACGSRAAFRFAGGEAVERRLHAMRAAPPPEAATFLAALTLPASAPGAPPRLTRREAQVLSQLADGGSDKMIGRRMGVSEHAVRFHLKNLFRKLGVRDRASAAARFARDASPDNQKPTK